MQWWCGAAGGAALCTCSSPLQLPYGHHTELEPLVGCPLQQAPLPAPAASIQPFVLCLHASWCTPRRSTSLAASASASAGCCAALLSWRCSQESCCSSPTSKCVAEDSRNKRWQEGLVDRTVSLTCGVICVSATTNIHRVVVCCLQQGVPRVGAIQVWCMHALNSPSTANAACACASVPAAVLFRYLEPAMANSIVPLSQSDWPRVVERVLKLALPTLYVWLAMFYCLFHLWLNILAELTRFGDREFYKVRGSSTRCEPSPGVHFAPCRGLAGATWGYKEDICNVGARVKACGLRGAYVEGSRGPTTCCLSVCLSVVCGVVGPASRLGPSGQPTHITLLVRRLFGSVDCLHQTGLALSSLLLTLNAATPPFPPLPCCAQDWWNAATVGDYWKLWNMPVHKWLLRTVYFPAMAAGIGR